MLRLLSVAQTAFGLFGLCLCSWLYVRYHQPLENAFVQLDSMAADTQVELALSLELANSSAAIVGELQSATTTHRQTLESSQRVSSAIQENLNTWQRQLLSFSSVSNRAASASERFAAQLPLRVPNVVYDLEKIDFEIPTVRLREQTISLPYPTAKLGKRREELDVGITKLKLDVPTLELATGEKQVTMAAAPDISIVRRSISVPNDFRITYAELFTAEKKLLEELSSELIATSHSLDESASTVGQVRELMSRDLMVSIDASKSNLELLEAKLQEVGRSQIPAAIGRIENQSTQLDAARASFADLQTIVPWSFLILGMIPMAILIHGLAMCSKTFGNVSNEFPNRS